MKNIVLSFLMCCTIAKSQTLEVTYELLLEKYEENHKNQIINESLQQLNNTKQFFFLTANSEGSLFKMKNQPINEEEKSNVDIQRILAGVDEFYFNSTTKELFLITEDVVVQKNKKQNWQLTNESKTINNYTCYKATFEWEITNRLGKQIMRKAVAWYSPELNYSYGPNGFQGLPGLILELEVNNNKLVAKKIAINNQKTKINFPTTKPISETEYLKKLKENSQF